MRLLYGAPFADAGVALRFILPGIVAYSAVAVLTRYITGRGRPGTTTVIMLGGLSTNVIANVFLIPRLGTNGAALASSISYAITAFVTVLVFRRCPAAASRRPSSSGRPTSGRWSGRSAPSVTGSPAGGRGRWSDCEAASRPPALVMDELEPGDEH